MDKNFPQPSQKRACHSYRGDWQDLHEIYESPFLSVANPRDSLSVHPPSDVHHISRTQELDITESASHGTAAEIQPLHGTRHVRSTKPFSYRPLTADPEPTCQSPNGSDQQIFESLNYAEGTDLDSIYQQTLNNLDYSNYAEGTDFDNAY